jgi:quercetin dioxygenase-like cupin family protein
MNYKIDNVKKYTKTRDWLCGQFFPKGSVLKNPDLEVKYSTLMPGDIYPPHYHPHGTEVSIVIKGKIKYWVDGREVILNDGDFVFMYAIVNEAILEVYEPTTMVSIRTPSVPNNKINLNYKV